MRNPKRWLRNWWSRRWVSRTTYENMLLDKSRRTGELSGIIYTQNIEIRNLRQTNYSIQFHADPLADKIQINIQVSKTFIMGHAASKEKLKLDLAELIVRESLYRLYPMLGL